MEVGFGIPPLVVSTGIKSCDGGSEGSNVDAGCLGERTPQLVLFTSGVSETLSDLCLVVETGFGRKSVDLIEKVDQIQSVPVEGGRGRVSAGGHRLRVGDSGCGRVCWLSGHI